MNKKELKKLILEENEHRIMEYYDSEESKEKRIKVADTLIDFLSSKNDQFRVDIISFFGGGGFSYGKLVGESFEVYERIMLNKKKILNVMIELLNHSNPKIRERVVEQIAYFEDGDGNYYFLEQCRARIFELLTDQSLAVQKEAGLSVLCLAVMMQKKGEYEDYLEILAFLHQNETIFSYAINWGKFKDLIIPILNEIKEGNDIPLREEAAKMLENVLNVI